MERLDKLLASQGLTTRREAQKWIRAGSVLVDGQPARDPAGKYDPDRQTILVNGRPLCYKKFLYIMLNKPAGLLCVSRDPHQPTVIDCLPAQWQRKGLFPAGRLDKDTHGFVLITDNGDFAHRLLSPRSTIFKRYRAIIDGPIGPEDVQAFAQGTSLEDGTRCLPAKLQVVEPGERPLVEVEICEGKYHQIKRMFLSLNRKVLWLKRYSLGGLELDETLEEGACREITAEEKERIFG